MTKNVALFLVSVAFVAILWAIWHRPQPLPGGSVESMTTANPKPNKAERPNTNQAHTGAFRTFPIASDGTVLVPVRFQLPGVERVRTASGFDQWVAQFPGDEKEQIVAFNDRHFGVYRVNSPQQVAWMAQMGYPMPEDIVAAKFLSDQDLREMAARGNDKAGFMLHEREVDFLKTKYAELATQGQTRSDFWRNDPNAMQYNKDDLQYHQLMLTSVSPFKGFVQAQDAVLDEDTEYAPATIISGLMWAQSFGDFRVGRFIDAYVGNDPMRTAMLYGAQAMGLNGTYNISTLRGMGCAGFNVGNIIPGTVSPVH